LDRKHEHIWKQLGLYVVDGSWEELFLYQPIMNYLYIYNCMCHDGHIEGWYEKTGVMTIHWWFLLRV